MARAGYELRNYYDGVDKDGAPVAAFEGAARTSDADLKVRAVHYEHVGDLIEIPAGTFMMGSSDNLESPHYDPERDPDETLHPVTLSQYRIATNQVNNRLWDWVMGTNRSDQYGGDYPVVDYYDTDIEDFLERLYEKTGERFRLPTEAEWERAAKAGTTGSRYGPVGAIAWTYENSDGRIHAVGEKEANAWGLEDMLGNTWELTQDRYGDYPEGHMIDPKGPVTGSYRVIRGGSWSLDAGSARSTNRSFVDPSNRYHDVGFRLALTVDHR